MNAQEKTAFRLAILEQLEELEMDIHRLEKASAPVAPDKALGRLTRMESLNDQGISQAALSRAREKKYKLEQTLERLMSPDFGRCISCGCEIPMERLKLLPESTKCVQCS